MECEGCGGEYSRAYLSTHQRLYCEEPDVNVVEESDDRVDDGGDQVAEILVNDFGDVIESSEVGMVPLLEDIDLTFEVQIIKYNWEPNNQSLDMKA